MEITDKQIKKTFIWNTVGYIGYLGFQWLITILVVRLSGYVDAGILSLAMSTTSMFHLIAGYGMRSFQISDTGKYTEREYLWSRYITCAAAFLLCFVFINVKTYTHIQRIDIMLYMVFKVGEAFVDVFNGMVQKLWRLDLVGKSYLLRGILTVISFSVILFLTHDLGMAILAMGMSSWLVIIFYDRRWAYTIVDFSAGGKLKNVRGLLKECMPLVVFYFFTSYINFVPRYALEISSGTEVLGIYSSLASPTLIVQSCAQVMFIPLIPLFAIHFKEGRKKSFNKLMVKCILSLIVLGIAVFIGALLFGEWLYTLLLGEKIRQYISWLYPVIGCTLMVSAMWLISNVLIALRCLKAIIISGGVGFIVCIFASPILVYNLGANGVSWAQIITLGVVCLLMIFTLMRKIRGIHCQEMVL